jgi:hypothetical protein
VHLWVNYCPSINGLLAQCLRFAQKNNPRNIKRMPACPGTSTGRLFFSNDLILNKKLHF